MIALHWKHLWMGQAQHLSRNSSCPGWNRLVQRLDSNYFFPMLEICRLSSPAESSSSRVYVSDPTVFCPERWAVIIKNVGTKRTAKLERIMRKSWQLRIETDVSTDVRFSQLCQKRFHGVLFLYLKVSKKQSYRANAYISNQPSIKPNSSGLGQESSKKRKQESLKRKIC